MNPSRWFFAVFLTVGASELCCAGPFHAQCKVDWYAFFSVVHTLQMCYVDEYCIISSIVVNVQFILKLLPYFCHNSFNLMCFTSMRTFVIICKIMRGLGSENQKQVKVKPIRIRQSSSNILSDKQIQLHGDYSCLLLFVQPVCPLGGTTGKAMR